MLIVKQDKLVKRTIHVEREDLTDREFQILGFLCQGNTIPQIGAQLVISRSTVRQHVKHLREKFDAHTIHQVVAFAYMDDIVQCHA